MSVATKAPLRMAGAQIFSGGPNTGDLRTTFGGDVCVSFFSGGLAASILAAPGAAVTADHAVIFSGPGRLKSIIQINAVQSGQPVIFYDSAIVARSGPFLMESGMKVIGVLPPALIAGSWSGVAPPVVPPVIEVGSPFGSGLSVALRSGIGGFSVTYTPEVNPNLGAGPG